MLKEIKICNIYLVYVTMCEYIEEPFDIKEYSVNYVEKPFIEKPFYNCVEKQLKQT